MMWDEINNWIKKYPNSIIQDDNCVFTYEAFAQEVENLANKLNDLFIRGCKCAVLCQKNMNTGLCILACWKADIVPIPMSIVYGIEHCKKIATLTSPDIILSDTIIHDYFSDLPIKACDLSDIGIYKMNQSIMAENNLSDVASIMCTSGTTGSPKGIMLTHENMLSNVLDIADYFQLFPDDNILIARPLYHCGILTGEFLLAIFFGATICFIDGKYDPFQIANLIEEKQISVLCGTPTLLNHVARIAMLSNQNHQLRMMAMMGERLQKDICVNIRKAYKSTNIFNLYGLTEASPRVSYLPSNLFDMHPESAGIPLKSVQVKIIASDGAEQKNGQDGILIVRSPSIMKGYYNDHSLTKTVIKDGWLYTGDIANIDKNGLLYIKSRADDMIVKGGMNIYPSEIETILKRNKEILDVNVYGQGSNIVVEVLLNSNYKDLSHKDLMQICSRTLPSYLMPDKLLIVGQISVNATGKRTHVREEG